MARTKLPPSPFLDNPPSASSSSEEEAEEQEIEGGGEAENGSDSDDVLKKKFTEENKNKLSDADSDDFFEFSKNPNPKPNNVKAPAKPKRSNMERVWSEEDEIVVLEGVRDWKNKGETFNKVSGLISAKALGELLNEIKGSLHFSPVEKSQLYTKIRGLRRRYFNAMKNKNEDDEDPVFSKPHECRMYLIMKDIWADVYTRLRDKIQNAGGVDDTVEEVGDDEDNEDRNVKDKWELLDNLPVLGINECVSEEGLRLIGDTKKVKMFEKKWKRLHKEEVVVNLKRMKLLRETTEAVLEAVKSSKV